MPAWRTHLVNARQRGVRLTAETKAHETDFQVHRNRVLTASERAERAAITLMMRSDDLARTVARF